jgi:hypothetical protein
LKINKVVIKENYMNNLFDEIMENCNHKKVMILCKKLGRKLSFKSGKDVENLCHLIYWLYILDKKELAKRCIELTHNIPFDQNYNVWDFLHSIWGLEIRLLFEEGKNKDAEKIKETIDRHLLTPSKQFNETPEEMQKHENKRRDRFVVDTQSYKNEIDDALKDGDIKSANDWRFIALLSLIGDTATGLYPKLNKDKEGIEKIIKYYIKEILK